jgi:hypothetical protein
MRWTVLALLAYFAVISIQSADRPAVDAPVTVVRPLFATDADGLSALHDEMKAWRAAYQQWRRAAEHRNAGPWSSLGVSAHNELGRIQSRMYGIAIYLPDARIQRAAVAFVRTYESKLWAMGLAANSLRAHDPVARAQAVADYRRAADDAYRTFAVLAQLAPERAFGSDDARREPALF